MANAIVIESPDVLSVGFTNPVKPVFNTSIPTEPVVSVAIPQHLNVLFEKKETVSIEYSSFSIPTIDTSVTTDTSVSLSLPQELTVLLIAPDEYNYRPPDVANEPPTFTVNNLVSYHEGNTTAGTDLFRINLSDPDTSDEVQFTMDTYNSTYFAVTKTATNTYVVSAIINVPVGTYSFSGTLTDSDNATASFSKTINVLTEPVTVYVYGSTIGANDPNSTELLARERLGSLNGDEIVTSVVSGSILERFIAGDIGDSTITVSNGSATLSASDGLRDLKDLENLGAIDFSAGNRMLVILFPDTSNLSNRPASMYDLSLPSPQDAAGRYALYANATIAGTTASGLIFFNTSSPVNGHSNWIGLVSETGSSGNYSFSYYADEDTPS